jgi:hypothetical protein
LTNHYSELRVQWISLDEEPQPVATWGGLIFSTDPHTALGSDGHRYILKGPDPVVVIAEALAYELAAVVGLNVPPCAFCRIPGQHDIWFASRAQRQRGVDQLLFTDKIVNPELVPDCIAFDVWIANKDRNMGNLVGDPAGGRGGDTIELFAIDFEKADVLRGTSIFMVETMKPDSWWPRDELGRQCRGLPKPSQMCERIRRVHEHTIDGIFARLEHALEGMNIAWAEAGMRQLCSRASRIDRLVEEVWHV